MQETKATSLERQVTLNEIVEDLLGEHDQAAKVEST
jgi:hypothetical protein